MFSIINIDHERFIASNCKKLSYLLSFSLNAKNYQLTTKSKLVVVK